ncbi:MAG: hypothetical protein WD228_04460 [Mycobacterium sp.]
MQFDATKSRRRALVTASTAASLVVSLVGGTLALLLSDGPQQSPTALKPIQPPVSAPAIEPEPAPSADDQTDLSMFGLGDSSVSSMVDSGSSVSSTADVSGGAAQLGFTPSAASALPPLPALPSSQLPDAAAFPAGPAFDWNALLAPLVAAQANAQAANVAGSIIGGAVGLANSAAIVLGDLILFAAYANNGQPLLAALQNTLAAPGAAAGTALLTTMPPVPALPDLSGLSAAFAAAAAAPPFGVPAPPALPPLPTPEQFATSLAGLSALGALPALPPLTLPALPGAPPLPRPEEVVGGLVGGAIAIGVGGAILGTLFPPPSITRMLGMPF